MRFASDNYSGASRRVLDAVNAANDANEPSYGDDEFCRRASEKIAELFGCELEVGFVATGTAANCLALSMVAEPWQTIFCHKDSHLFLDESTAPELFTGGARLIPLAGEHGRLQVRDLDVALSTAGDAEPHNPVAAALSFANVNENGLVYTPDQVSALSERARAGGLAVHMDGARFANAIAALGCAPAELTWQAGVDVLSLGATKCGAMCAEAVVSFRPDDFASFAHRRKRAGHLVSKARWFGAQFQAWLDDGHWLDLAAHANRAAAELHGVLRQYRDIDVVWEVRANQLYVVMASSLADALLDAGAAFYPWYPSTLPGDYELANTDGIYRLVTSFATTRDEIAEFADALTACGATKR